MSSVGFRRFTWNLCSALSKSMTDLLSTNLHQSKLLCSASICHWVIKGKTRRGRCTIEKLIRTHFLKASLSAWTCSTTTLALGSCASLWKSLSSSSSTTVCKECSAALQRIFVRLSLVNSWSGYDLWDKSSWTLWSSYMASFWRVQ